MARYKCFFDGACVPKNPFGAMGFGWAIMDGNKFHLKPDTDTIEYGSGYEPASLKNSSNKAEYLALSGLLEWLLKNTEKGDEILIFGDSQLVIKQMNGEWGMKEGLYLSAASYADDLLDELRETRKCLLKWIPREQNSYADELSRLSFPDEIEIFLPHPCASKTNNLPLTKQSEK